MRIKLTLFPANGKVILPVSYNYFLTSLIYKIIKNSSEDYSRFLHDEGYKLGESKKGFKLFTYSMLTSKKFKIGGEKIIFLNSHVQWQISSPLDNFIQHLVTGVFAEGQEIEIGYINNRSSRSNSLNSLSGLNRFLIERVETLPRPEFKGMMKFTCLSPVTVSKVAGLNDLSGLNSSNGLTCHYLRPWEDGFTEAIKNNLIKKYTLVYEKDIEDSDFAIKIDTDYMNRKSGKITKNINFKGTNIIGFMSPFEVAGSPELIEIGYEAGFGEKGSMGFGMVKETV
ncbi:MAG: CRISPR-associated endoribonuclease Cas6 [Acetobacterium sp.]|nr:CRISPR-associated endoribonuclease Cas6 [Acetobacterium sp.]